MIVELDQITRATILVGVSLALVLSVLLLLGAIYRAASERLKLPVSVIHEAENELAIFLDRAHLPVSTHDGKYARLEFRTDSKGKPLYVSGPLKLRVRDRKDYINEQRICIENGTFNELKSYLPEQAIVKEGRYEVIKQPLYVKVQFNSIFNIGYLLNHPDLSVKATAWVFILTSGFATAQVLILDWLGF